MRKFVFSFLGLFLLHDCVVAQKGITTIDSVTIEGNRRTKNYIILREAQLKATDTLHLEGIAFRISEARRNVYNTTLFDLVLLQAKFSDDSLHCNIHFKVKERWPIYPLPIFALVDRSYGEWINTYKADLNRVVYGVKFAHYNFSGRRDQLRVQVFNGYNRGMSISYVNPYTNKKLTEGIALSGSYVESKEIQYNTNISNKLVTFTTPFRADVSSRSFINKAASFGIGYSIRQGIFNSQNFSLSFNHRSVNDSIGSSYNPNFFGNGKSQANFVDVAYRYRHVNVNNLAYPLKGDVYSVAVLKRGLGFSNAMDMFAIDGYYAKYFALPKEWYFVTSTQAAVKFPLNNLSTINQRGVGYENTLLRGLELFAIDGSAYGIAKSTIKKKVVHFKIKTPVKIPFFLKKKEAIPFTIFVKAYSDFGYVYNSQNKTNLSNRFLYTYGAGADLLTFYDTSIGFHYGFNQLNQNGLFLSISSVF